MAQEIGSVAQAEPSGAEGFWPKGWWAIVDYKIGIVPLPVFVILIGVIGGFAATGTVPSDILMAIVLLSMGGFTCAELGKRIPIIRNVGAAAIFATFIPSYLAFHHLLPDSILGSVKQFTKDFELSLSVHRLHHRRQHFGHGPRRSHQGLSQDLHPAGLRVGGRRHRRHRRRHSLGLGAYHTFFFVVVPIMAGGVGEGAIPLSIGYAQILHQAQGDLFAQVLPPVMLGSLTAILLSGTLNFVGKKYPHLTGEGRLQPGEHDELEFEEDHDETFVDVTTIAAAVVTAVTLYLIGALSQRLFGFPAPVAMLVIAVCLKLARAVSPSLQLGAFHVYKFFSTAVTYPLLFAIGVSLTPWDKLVAAFTVPYLITIVSTVVSIIATGFFVGGWLKMYPIDTAIVTACHSGQGGTGDVAILTAGNRMQLMPFAQIATRIGGAATVTMVLIILSQIG